MRSNRLILASLVLLTGFFMFAPQAYTLYRFYLWGGESLVATYVTSEKTSNSKDTVMMPLYRFSRQIGPVKQDCKIAAFSLVHGVDTPPPFQTLNLKVGENCADYIILNDMPKAAFILFSLGFLLFMFGFRLIFMARNTV